MPIALKQAAASPAGLLLAVALLPLIAATVAVGTAHAAEPIAFTIPAEDGYGIEDCMQAGNACGEAIATAYCEAQGHGKALAFGAADVTATTPLSSAHAAAPGSVMIRCGD